MLEPSGYKGPSPRYWAITLGLATLLSLLANVLVKSWLSAGLVLALVLVASFAIYRIRVLWYYSWTPKEIAQDQLFRWSAGVTLGLAGLLAFALPSLPTADTPVQVLQQPNPNAGVIACMQAHEMKDAYVRGREQEVKDDLGGQLPTPSQKDYLESLPGTELYRTRFSWCNWPRPAWAQADGYSEIVATEETGPDPLSLNFALAHRFQAPCAKLNAKFTLRLSGMDVSQWEVLVRIGQAIYSDGKPWPSAADFQKYGMVRDRFQAHRGEAVIIHHSRAYLDSVECVG